MMVSEEIERQLRISRDMWSDLVMLQSWPKQRFFDPESWIKNFKQSEKPFALRLVDNMTYYSEEMSVTLFKSAFHRLCKSILKESNYNDYNQALTNWQLFKNSAYIVPIGGESPNPSDSGFGYARYARDYCKTPQENIITLETAVKLALTDKPIKLIFVDDFLGSGEQFIKTWLRKVDVAGRFQSLANAFKMGKSIEVYVCTIISTKYAIENIKDFLPNATIVSAHIFSDYHSVLSNESYIWRDDMKTEGPQFIEEVSLRLGIPDLDGEIGENDQVCWRGFKKLGLCISFQNSMPDASIPLLSFSSDEWRPLIRIGK